jgi:hypothetical protein
MNYRPVGCPVCGEPLRHRVISNLRYCVNPVCSEYHGIPPIKVTAGKFHDGFEALSSSGWENYRKEAQG